MAFFTVGFHFYRVCCRNCGASVDFSEDLLQGWDMCVFVLVNYKVALDLTYLCPDA